MLSILLMLMFFFLISLILMMLNFLIYLKKMNNREKMSPFECGFDPLSSSRLPFSINFFMISIIFLIFDIEIIILLPILPNMIYSNIEISLNSMIIFILILLVGLFIEWNDGALKWLK